MAIVLGPNQYGKAEVRLVRVVRDTDTHEIKDVNVSIALSGDMTATHLTGDNSKVVPTDTQKNTVYAFARQQPFHDIEEFGLRLARHFVNEFPSIDRARVEIEEYAWERIQVASGPHPHAFRRASDEKRTTTVTFTGDKVAVVSGLYDLVVLKSTGSEFWGYVKDRYTTLRETRDRILATTVTARWRYLHTEVSWGKAFDNVRRVLVETFADTHSRSLQQTLYTMGRRVLEAHPEIAEIRLSMSNKHHILVDLTPFALDNPNLVFHADDRPYGLIEGTVVRDDAPDDPIAW